MGKYVSYEPQKHKGLPLYEIQSKEMGEGNIASVAVPTDISHELAAQMPFYYMVKSSDISKKSKESQLPLILNNQRVIIKGGPESGFHGHQGLPGIWGGSTARSGGGVSEITKKPSSKKRALRAAKKAVSNAQSTEKETTPMILKMVKEHEGELAKLEHRLKKPDSLTKKILGDVEEKGITEEEAASQINDTLRYTMLFESDTFVESVGKVQKELKARGWETYDEKQKNFFSPGDDYDGYNTVVWKPSTGEKFELQFHTPESMRIKSIVHKLYKEIQSTAPESPRRLEIYNEMVAAWKDYQRPRDWEKLEGRKIFRDMK